MNTDNLSMEEKKLLAAYGLDQVEPDGFQMKVYQKGEMLCEQGELMDALLLTTAGKIKVFTAAANGKTLLHCVNEPGKIIGEVEFITGGFASSGVSAVTEVQCIAIPFDRYREELMTNVAFLNRICSTMAEIITETSENGASNILYPFETRLCAYIWSAQENGRFSQKLTELAEFLGTSYRHLLRTLEALCAKGILKKTDHTFIIVNEHALKTIGNNFFFGINGTDGAAKKSADRPIPRRTSGL